MSFLQSSLFPGSQNIRRQPQSHPTDHLGSGDHFIQPKSRGDGHEVGIYTDTVVRIWRCTKRPHRSLSAAARDAQIRRIATCSGYVNAGGWQHWAGSGWCGSCWAGQEVMLYNPIVPAPYAFNRSHYLPIPKCNNEKRRAIWHRQRRRGVYLTTPVRWHHTHITISTGAY